VGDAKLQNGVLIFISSKDRAIFISAGSGTRDKLSDGTIDTIINRMKPHLKKSNWAGGFVSAILDVEHVLTEGKLSYKPGQRASERSGYENFFLLVFVAGVFGLMALLASWQSSKTAALRRGRAALDSLIKDVKKAEHKVYMSSSCPMCLEPFAKEVELGEEATTPAPTTTTTTTTASPSADSAAKAALVPKTLPCGHVFCEACIKEYLNVSAKATCPICRESIRHVDEGTAGEYEPVGGCGGMRRRHYHPHMQMVLFRSRRIRHLYPGAMDEGTHSVLHAAVHSGTLSDAIAVVERRSVEVESILADMVKKAKASGSSKSSFGGGRSGGGRGGRF
jgi:uncharacterized membrane protein YgcG